MICNKFGCISLIYWFLAWSWTQVIFHIHYHHSNDSSRQMILNQWLIKHKTFRDCVFELLLHIPIHRYQKYRAQLSLWKFVCFKTAGFQCYPGIQSYPMLRYYLDILILKVQFVKDAFLNISSRKLLLNKYLKFHMHKLHNKVAIFIQSENPWTPNVLNICFAA